jgi:hypothetical protein
MNRKEEMYAHVERCEAGTQTQREYCQEYGLNLSTFYYWRKRYRDEQPESSSPEFVTVTSDVTRNFNNGKIEVIFPDGSRLYCGYDVPAVLLRALTGR